MPSGHDHAAFHKQLDASFDWASLRERQRARLPLVDAWWRLARVAPAARVLDVGCGPGAFAEAYAARLREPGFVWASDVVPEALALVRAGPRLRTLRHDAHAPWPEDVRVDVAFVTDVLHHADDPRLVLRNLRAAAPRLLVSEFDPRGAGEVGPPLEMRLAEGELERVLSQAGWRVDERAPVLGHEHYALTAVRAPAALR